MRDLKFEETHVLLLAVKMGAEHGGNTGSLQELRLSPAGSCMNSETASPQRMQHRVWPGSPRAEVAVWLGLSAHRTMGGSTVPFQAAKFVVTSHSKRNESRFCW